MDKDRIEKYGFIENEDFATFAEKTAKGRPSIEYAISINMAKKLSMVERNEKGKQARQYFIECERKTLEAVNPVEILNNPSAMRGLLLNYTEKSLHLNIKSMR
ncbi:antA/AntB antirepressor family protein [Arsenophonus endosymbiont of Aleurodicus floccissimus]|uniref:antA/AntB antirepressor family protein n=1 Tax=Arsenophonus endosymbiont of Aleurodicus floccissimus TaxID=2152761 RepID=UPI001EDF2854|nr:antA/AntB antirepressor family protein [Arsenophonus endosymbiont of Aleurodicus floccissimus]